MVEARRTCGVLGDPIGHSLSPVLHRAGYAAVGLEWTYDAHRVPAGTLEDFLAGVGPEWVGMSLTMPLKREALRLVDRVSERARQAGGVNTVLLGEELVGDNTDLPGAVSAIRERTDAVLDRAVVLGGGATATSTGLALVEAGVRRLTVAVRSVERAAETVTAIEAHPASPLVEVVELTEVSGSGVDAVVCTIPAVAQDARLVDSLADVPVVFDVVYDPWPTPLAAAATGVVVSGMDLLVHQAALQFTLFTGLEAPLEQMRAAGEAALAARAVGSSGESPS